METSRCWPATARSRAAIEGTPVCRCARAFCLCRAATLGPFTIRSTWRRLIARQRGRLDYDATFDGRALRLSIGTGANLDRLASFF
jgi:hypothetical protein